MTAHNVDTAPAAPTAEELIEHLDVAWGVIANAGGTQGGWPSESPEWVEAAERWRDRFDELLRAWCATRPEKTIP